MCQALEVKEHKSAGRGKPSQLNRCGRQLACVNRPEMRREIQMMQMDDWEEKRMACSHPERQNRLGVRTQLKVARL